MGLQKYPPTEDAKQSTHFEARTNLDTYLCRLSPKTQNLRHL